MEAVTRLERLGLARTLRVVAVVVVARLARCAWWLWLGSHAAPSAVGALTPHNRLYISAAPQILFIKWLPQNLPQRQKNDIYAALLFRSTVFNS